ncbi:MAG TPA: ThuA domain-containing protein [Verrucomicrobium sp.]|nr:ThuA domain-containing protein [Verrucomicrobium sp.]
MLSRLLLLAAILFLPLNALAQAKGPLPKVLFFANPMGSDNDVIRRSSTGELSVAERNFEELSKGIFEIKITQDGREVTAAKLPQYDAIVFFTAINPPGVDVEALTAWVSNGGAFVGIHSTANTYQGIPAFGEMLGARYDRRPWRTREAPQTKVRVKVENQSHSTTKHFGTSFEIADDLYQFKNFDRSRVAVLLSLDPKSLDMANPKVNANDKDLPVSWAKMHGSGRVFYTALGDWEPTWKDPDYRTHLIEGIRWAIKK